jgi:hypothetical protein
MQETGLGTNRAIAVLADDPLGSLDLEDNRFAVTTTAIDHGFAFSMKNAAIADPAYHQRDIRKQSEAIIVDRSTIDGPSGGHGLKALLARRVRTLRRPYDKLPSCQSVKEALNEIHLFRASSKSDPAIQD